MPELLRRRLESDDRWGLMPNLMRRGAQQEPEQQGASVED